MHSLLDCLFARLLSKKNGDFFFFFCSEGKGDRGAWSRYAMLWILMRAREFRLHTGFYH